MNNRQAAIVPAVLLGLFLASPVAAAEASPRQDPPERARIQAALERLHKAGTIPGINAAVMLPDGRLLVASAGWRDREAREALRSRDLMLCGSIGKTYVAALALQFVKEGSLSLDEKAERYLGREAWFRRLPNAGEVTIRMLLNHTSGWPRHDAKPAFLRSVLHIPDKTWTPQELLGFLNEDAALFPAGQGWHYSDSNYILVGVVLERLAGRPYYELLKKRLLIPLGLKETVPSDKRRIRGLVQGYAGTDNPFGVPDAMLVGGVMAVNPQAEWTGGGVAATARDLARWAKLLFEGQAFDPALLPVMLTGVATGSGPEHRYGLGVVLRPTPLGPSYSHGGIFPGYRSVIVYLPEKGLSVALQLNTSDDKAFPKPYFEMALDLARAALGPGPVEPNGD